MTFRGLGDFVLVVARKCSYSRLNALPTEEVEIEPVHTRYAVMALKILLSLPLNVWPLHRPRPLGSRISSPIAIETIDFVDSVIVPPD